jgi:hypothetical protein
MTKEKAPNETRTGGTRRADLGDELRTFNPLMLAIRIDQDSAGSRLVLPLQA